MQIAALLTCYNRKSKTVECLSSLFRICPKIHVHLVDDASTDGTSETVKRMFPQVNIIHGTGNLYWNRGMYTAWKEALKGNFDYYLWLNDDVKLYDFAIDELLQVEHLFKNGCIVTGLIENEIKTEILYGGYDENKQLITSNEMPQKVMYMNGNVVLVPQNVVGKIGILDSRFHHDLGDVDYGLTAMETWDKSVFYVSPYCFRICK